jgi:hypothetical protein
VTVPLLHLQYARLGRFAVSIVVCSAPLVACGALDGHPWFLCRSSIRS